MKDLGVPVTVATLVIAFVVIVVLILIIRNIQIVPQAHCYVVERLGKYKKTWNAGLNVKVPGIDKVVKRLSLKEQIMDSPPQPVITKDNVTMQIDSVVYFKIFDPKLYTYGIEDPILGLKNLAYTTIRNIVGDMELDETLTSRDEINTQMRAIMDEATDPWGIKVTRVEIKNIDPPKEIEEAMSKQMKAERDRRQTVLEAQAHQEAVVARAEGDKKAKILAAEAERDAQIALAEGRAKSIQMVYEAESKGIERLANSGINDSVLKWNGIKALKDVADGRATKIFMPTDLAGLISNLGVAAESLGIGQSESIDKSAKVLPTGYTDDCGAENSKASHSVAEASERISKEVINDVGARVREQRENIVTD